VTAESTNPATNATTIAEVLPAADLVANPPLIGAALLIEDLPTYAGWVLSGQRDLEIQDPYLPAFLDGDWRALVREARAMLDGYTGRLGIHGPFFGIDIAVTDPKLRQVMVERLCQGVEIAQALGGSHMVVHSPFDFFGHAQVCHTPAMGLDYEIGNVQETLASVVELAEQAGVTLVIENIRDANTTPLRALVSSFKSEFVRMSLDTGHAYIWQRNGGPPPDQWVRDAGALLAHVHVQDTDDLWDRHWAPGAGNINWAALFAALGELTQPPRLVLEMRRRADVARGAAWLTARGLAR
jgi:sugar phosphate isomerase/epimerase